MPSAKGLVPEQHPHFIGIYWGVASNAFCGEIVETADASLFVGPVFDDFNSVGDTLLLRKNKAIIVEPERVLIPNGPIFGCVLMKDFLEALSKKLEHNTTAYENHNWIHVPEPEALPKSDSKEGLKVNVLLKHVQKMLLGDMVVNAETGDSWFLCQKLGLSQGYR
ncbi:hypothetical protein LWI29_020916 [Acer saccharum]|uniref:Thiamine pyrophosphate enzyme central domain-containing protein n=1 Tax=Acer saccharum TaxID=4024 RepID=A0AA39VLF1_ACESA|nr:hypothetical protein LWI29_020916 [Acer saccharum]